MKKFVLATLLLGSAVLTSAAHAGNPKPTNVDSADIKPAYLLRKTDDSPLTQLCVAAALSEQEYSKVKAAHFSDEADTAIATEVQCNGVPLRAFVRKFRESDVRLVSQR